MSARMSRAILCYESGDIIRAEAEIRSALAAGEDTTEMRALLALCLLRSGLLDAAAQESKAALARDPACAYAHYVQSFVAWAEFLTMRIPVLGPGLRQRSQAQAGYESARQAVELAPTEARYLVRLAELERTFCGRPEASLTAAEQALALEPSNLGAAIERATALNHLRRKAEARGTLLQTLAAHPAISQAHAGLGWELLRAGDRKRATAFFDEALRLDASSPWAQAGALEAAKYRYRSYRILAVGKQWFRHQPLMLQALGRLFAFMTGVVGLMTLVAVLDIQVRPHLGDNVTGLVILSVLVIPVMAILYHDAIFTWLVRRQPAAQTSSAMVRRKSVSEQLVILLLIVCGTGMLVGVKAFAPRQLPVLCGLLPGCYGLWIVFRRTHAGNRPGWFLPYAILLLIGGPLVAIHWQDWFPALEGVGNFAALLIPLLPLLVITQRLERAKHQQTHDKAVAAVTRNSH
jgi:tetratricopeptide (TPR) repeat protein